MYHLCTRWSMLHDPKPLALNSKRYTLCRPHTPSVGRVSRTVSTDLETVFCIDSKLHTLSPRHYALHP